MSKFGGQGEDSAPPDSTLLSAGAPNALAGFLDQFTTLTESYFFYNNTVELRFNVADHKYYLVSPDLGNLIEQYVVTTVLRIIDKSPALVPWASKKCAEKILRTIPLSTTKDEFGSILLAPITLEDFTKLVLKAKNAHKEILEDAGDIGHMAHKCLENSIQHAIDHTQGIVQELREVPTDEKAKAAAEAGFAWMRAHHVRWVGTERKIYSKKYAYAGTADGLAWVDSCEDKSCCSEQYKGHLALVDWKSSNSLHEEYCYQTAAYLQALIEEFRDGTV